MPLHANDFLDYWCGRLHPVCVSVTGCLMEPEKPLGGIGLHENLLSAAAGAMESEETKPLLAMRMTKGSSPA